MMIGTIPQGLKPAILLSLFGTAEAVPLPVQHERKFCGEAVRRGEFCSL
jgi:hypothetical protein